MSGRRSIHCDVIDIDLTSPDRCGSQSHRGEGKLMRTRLDDRETREENENEERSEDGAMTRGPIAMNELNRW